jgi:short subunit dehydrogenase-like uncharacterized protein
VHGESCPVRQLAIKLIACISKLNNLRPCWSPAPTCDVRSLARSRDCRILPSTAKRDAQPTFVWGEVTNARGEKRTARIKTANGYSLTVSGALAVVEHLLTRDVPAGAYTPAKLMGPDLVIRLPGSGPMQIT